MLLSRSFSSGRWAVWRGGGGGVGGAGETVVEPLIGNVSAPSISMSGLTLVVCAFAEFHVSVTRSPAVMVVRSAPAEIVGAAVNTCTVVLALAVTPPPPFAVAVYVVVAEGVTVTLPLAATLPTP